GHSDVVGGAIVVKDKELAERLYFLQNAVGAILGPMDSFLVLRGIKTLPLRMERHAENAAAIVDFLAAHPKVEKVYYPYHESHPQHQLARRQMKNGGGMISFLVKGGHEAAVRLVESTELFALAESLGGVESLIEVPAAMTHLSVAGSQLDVDPSLVRLSVGIENVEDLLADLRQALG
ncbi:MAG: cystathionine gamma-synthase, partial [Anaerolineae bacterium]|nr:cystathionine gamma-synthase [Anaerolineae bacterium]